MHWGLPCSNDRLSSSLLEACAHLNSSCLTFSSFGKTPMMMGPTCDDPVIKRVDLRIKGNLLKIKATVLSNNFNG
jgi:hypothetical protein